MAGDPTKVNAIAGMMFPSLALFSASLVLTAVSLWIAGRLAPWFLKDACDPPTLRSYFLDPQAELDMSKGRVVTVLLAVAIMLAVLLGLAIAVRFGGIALI
jgi:hypothetical protein